MSSLQANRNFQLFIGLFLFTEVVFLFYWLALYPGLVSVDLGNQWCQVVADCPQQLNNHHPYLHSLWLRALAFGIPRIEIVFVTNIIFSGALFAGFSTWLMMRGVKAWAVIPFHVLLTLSPVTATYNLIPIKDMSAAQFILLFVWGWLIITTTKLTVNRWSIAGMVALAVVGFLGAYFRHNHVVLIPVILLMVIVLRQIPTRLRIIYAAVLLSFVILHRIPLQAGWVETRDDETRLLETKLWLVSFSYQNRSPAMTREERDFLATLVRTRDLTRYNCHHLGIFRRQSVFSDAYDPQNPEMVRKIDDIFYGEVFNAPHLIAMQRLCVNLPAWGLPPGGTIYPVLNVDSVLERVGIGGIDPPISFLNETMQSVVDWAQERPQRYFIWNHIYALVLLSSMGLLAVYRRSIALGGIFLIFFTLVASLFAVNIVNKFQYYFYLYYIAFFAIPIMLLPSETESSILYRD